MKYIIAAAGTGGHINPGIAIANKIKEEDKNAQILFIGTNRGLENDLVPRAGYMLKNINSYGISRKLSIENIKKLYRTFQSVGEAKKIIDDFKPDVVIGTGGYICVSVGFAARSRKIPIVLHESNAFPGVAVKLLANKVACVMTGFQDTKARIKKASRIVVTGTPTKIRNLHFTKQEKEKEKERLNLAFNLPVVLVYGGSQGARSINDAMVTIMKEKLNTKYQIMWAAGANNYDQVKEEFDKMGISMNQLRNVKIVPYIYNMEEVMNTIDLVVARSGAMTITELSMVGKPAIFIPFPYATENHQEYNANVMVKANAAKMILDKDLTGEMLNKMIESIVTNQEKINEMSNQSQKLAILEVEDKIYQEIKRAIKK